MIPEKLQQLDIIYIDAQKSLFPWIRPDKNQVQAAVNNAFQSILFEFEKKLSVSDKTRFLEETIIPLNRQFDRYAAFLTHLDIGPLSCKYLRGEKTKHFLELLIRPMKQIPFTAKCILWKNGQNTMICKAELIERIEFICSACIQLGDRFTLEFTFGAQVISIEREITIFDPLFEVDVYSAEDIFVSLRQKEARMLQ